MTSQAFVQKSSGCFPGQTAVGSVDRDDLKKLTYSTAYRTGTPWRKMAQEDKWENFSDVHAIGKKDTPYLRYQKNTAPLLDHSALCSRRDFIAQPLGDNVINRALANSFKSGTFTSRKGLDVSAKQDTCYTAEFVEYDPRRMASAKQKSYKPKAGRTQPLSSMTHLMETRSASQLNFVPPHAELAKAAEISLARPNLGLSGSWNGGPPKSSYGHEFNRSLQRSQSVGGLSLPEAPIDLLPHSHPVFHVRRACHMSPGQ